MSLMYKFEDRTEVGKKLAHDLLHYHFHDPFVLALSCGGVPIAREIALKLGAPMDVLIVKKIRAASSNEASAIGSMCEDLEPVFSESALVREEGHYGREMEKILKEEKNDLKRKVLLYRGRRKIPRVKGRTVILVDDGVETGAAVAAAAKYLRSKGPKEIFVASPICPEQDSSLMFLYIDRIVCAERMGIFSEMEEFYKNFNRVSDEEVVAILKEFHPDLSLNQCAAN